MPSVSFLCIAIVASLASSVAANAEVLPSANVSRVSVAFVYADFVEAVGAAAPFWHDWGFPKAMKFLSRAFEVTWYNVADAQQAQLLRKRLKLALNVGKRRECAKHPNKAALRRMHQTNARITRVLCRRHHHTRALVIVARLPTACVSHAMV